MDELVFYAGAGVGKKHDNSFGYLSSLHSSKQYIQYRQCYCGENGAVSTGLGQESKTLVACNGIPIVNVYLYGKESLEQKITVPEPLACLEIVGEDRSCGDQSTGISSHVSGSSLLIGGGVSGKLYVWQLSTGLLLAARESHYQRVTSIKYRKGFVVSSGADSRVVIWKLLDLLSPSDKSVSAHSVYTDSTLPVRGICVTNGLVSDIKVFTCSEDCTVRCYNLISKALLTTFVLPSKVLSIATDPAYRALYAGLADGTVRIIPLYRVNPSSHVLEAVGGLGSIVTVKESDSYFSAHQKGGATVTQVAVTFDGTRIVSGDSKGNVFVSDVATKMVVKKFKSVVGEVSQLTVYTAKSDDPRLDRQQKYKDKNMVKGIPVLKRVLADSNELDKSELVTKESELEISGENELDLSSIIVKAKAEERWFSGEDEVVQTSSASQSELEKMKEDFATLRRKYQDLYKEYAKTQQ